MECLPNLVSEYNGITLSEFNLDAALARHPQLILVDELAHTNAPVCRHTKRYQDIEELSRTVVVELIRQIRVYDKKNIEITFDFDDCYQTLLNQLPAMGVDMVIDDDNNLQVNVKEVV